MVPIKKETADKRECKVEYNANVSNSNAVPSPIGKSKLNLKNEPCAGGEAWKRKDSTKL